MKEQSVDIKITKRTWRGPELPLMREDQLEFIEDSVQCVMENIAYHMMRESERKLLDQAREMRGQ